MKREMIIKDNIQGVKRGLKTLIFTMMAMMPTTIMAQTIKINIGDAQFTKPLLERWISEYHKVNPDFNAELVAQSGGENTVSVSSRYSNDRNLVGRYFVLPIANANGDILNEKKVQKGLTESVKKEIFVKKDIDEYLDSRDKKKLPGTVYALTGRHGSTTEIFANSLNVSATEITGRKILGREENGISLVQKQKDAVSLNVANLIYDRSTRKPVTGLAVLPIDLDGDGKVSDDERTALDNIDSLTDYLKNSSIRNVAAGYIKINTSNSSLNAFISWVETEGQNYLKEYGYLPVHNGFIAQN